MKLKKLLVVFVVLFSFHFVGSGQKFYQFHFSVVPSVSSHGNESKNHSYFCSFNLFGGQVNTINGFEFGSIYNQNFGNMIGAQIAGIGNITKGKVEGSQIAGISNITGAVKGVQIAGIMNKSKDISGFQLAGLTNLANDVKGVQISGIYNRAKKVKGFQLGLINKADTVESGAVIGLINHVSKGGYRSLELHASDYQNFAITYKSGTKKVYSILSVGYSDLPERLFSAGFGLGKLIMLGKSYTVAPEIIWYTFSNTKFKDIRNTHSAHLRLAIMQKIYKHVAVTLTPSVYLAIKENVNGIYGYDISRFSSFGSDFNRNNKVEYGYGLSLGISVFN